MIDDEINEVTKLEWTKRWASRFSLLSCSYWGRQYVDIARRELGAGFEHILFIYKEGIATCYRVKSETAIFGEFIAKKAIQDNDLVERWSNGLKRQTDLIESLITETIEEFIKPEKFSQFEEEFDKYYPFAGVNNTISDFLPPEIFKKYELMLLEARKYSEKVYNNTDEYFTRLIEYIAKREKYDSTFLLALVRDELNSYINTGKLPNRNQLESRYHKSALYFTNNALHIFLGSDVDSLEKKIVNTQNKDDKAIVGRIACPGHVKGIVRIILDPKKIGTFNHGDILVTSMTRPDFVPLMKKSAAVITDAGGILSHAAIVSRELNIPCIIGTEYATVKLKDGDLVEVDADKGIIIKL